MNVDLVIFDKDGTLIDIHYYWGGMIKLRAKMLCQLYVKPKFQEKVVNELMSNMGINIKTKKIKSMGPVGIKPRNFIANVAYQTLKPYFNAITINQVLSIFKDVDVQSQLIIKEIVKPLPGVEALLLKLQQKKIAIAIATTDLTSSAQLAMKSVGLFSYFDEIAGSDLVASDKPNPDLVDYLCEKMMIQKSKVLVIGDSIVDLEMAESAKVNFVGVKTGLHSPQFIERSKILFNNAIDLQSLF